ncbi:MAG: hypothetical protein U1D30_04475 [Planctomycetota bacterium]
MIRAVDSDKYRFRWVVGPYLVGAASGMAMTRFIGSRVGPAGIPRGLLLFSATSAALRLGEG